MTPCLTRLCSNSLSTLAALSCDTLRLSQLRTDFVLPNRSRGHAHIPRAAQSSGRGFGVGAQQRRRKGSKKGGGGDVEEQAVASILKKLESQEQGIPQSDATLSLIDETRSEKGAQVGMADALAVGRKGLSQVDPKQAARGRVDYVQVENWEPHLPQGDSSSAKQLSAEDRETLGNLKVRSVSPGLEASPALPQGSRQQSKGPAGEEKGEGAAGSPGLYERLVHHLQLLDSRGEIAVARPRGAPPLPPFERWDFGAGRFLQYLVDLLAVHRSLEEAAAAAAATLSTETTPLGGPVTQSAGASRDGSSESDAREGRVAATLPLLDLSLGLQRAQALEGDIQALLASGRGLGDSGQADGLSVPPKPTTQAAAYASYIGNLARPLQSAAVAAASLSPASLLERKTARPDGAGTTTGGQQRRAALKILANAFAVYVAQFTTGMRVGTNAVEALPAVRRARAVRLFQEYPPHIGDPLKTFIAAVDSCGSGLSGEDFEVLAAELPRAVVKTSLLMSVLAVERTEGALSSR